MTASQWEMSPGDTTATPSRLGKQCSSTINALRLKADGTCCPTCGCWCIATIAYLTGAGLSSCQAGLCWGADAFHVANVPTATGDCAGDIFTIGVHTSQNTALCVGTTVNVSFTLRPTAGWVLYYTGPDPFGNTAVVYANIQFQNSNGPCCDGTTPCYTNVDVPGPPLGQLLCNDGSPCFFVGGCADSSCAYRPCADIVMTPYAPFVEVFRSSGTGHGPC